MNFLGAGIFFTNGNLVLSGYQANKEIPMIGGIGGKKELNETYQETAIRETLEELFDIEPTKEIIKLINMNIIYKKTMIQNNYIILVHTFEDLELILLKLNQYNIISPLYDIFPTTISELILRRKYEEDSEISHLCLLPLKENLQIDPDFNQDVHCYLTQT